VLLPTLAAEALPNPKLMAMTHQPMFSADGPPMFAEVPLLEPDTCDFTVSQKEERSESAKNRGYERRQKQRAKKRLIKALAVGSHSVEFLHSIRAEAKDGDIGIGPHGANVPLPRLAEPSTEYKHIQQ